jgi:hypothetical protein
VWTFVPPMVNLDTYKKTTKTWQAQVNTQRRFGILPKRFSLFILFLIQ